MWNLFVFQHISAGSINHNLSLGTHTFTYRALAAKHIATLYFNPSLTNNPCDTPNGAYKNRTVKIFALVSNTDASYGQITGARGPFRARSGKPKWFTRLILGTE